MGFSSEKNASRVLPMFLIPRSPPFLRILAGSASKKF
jgi:hypothetical protein